MIKAMERKLIFIIDQGQKFTDNFKCKRYLKIVNTMALIVAFYDFFLSIGALCLKQYILALELSTISFLCLLIPYINSLGRIQTSRLLFAVIGCFAVSVISLFLGKASGVHVALILAACSPFLIVSIEEKSLLFASLFSPVFIFFMLGFFNYHLGPKIDFNVIHQYQNLISNVFWFFTFSLVAAISYLFSKQQYESEKDLKSANEKLREENITRIETEQKLLKANQNIETLIEVMAHDMANSIMSASLVAEIVKKHIDGKDTVDTAQIKKSMDKLSVVTTNMNDLTHKVVKMRSVQKNIDHIDTEDVQIKIIISRIREIFDLPYAQKQIELKIICRLDEEKNYINVDTVLFINQVLGNLLSNAMKFSFARGRVDLTITRKSEDFICFSIRDYGIGMPERIKTHLFQIGEKKSRPGTSGEKGTGFGMALCYHFIKKMKGDISVESWTEEVDGQPTGTLFKVMVPAALPPQSDK